MQTYTYRQGQKFYLNAADNEFVTRLLPAELQDLGITNSEQVSSRSSKVVAAPEELETVMARCSEAAATHPAYYLADSRQEFLLTDRLFITLHEPLEEEALGALLGKYGLILLESYSPVDFLVQMSRHAMPNPVDLVVALTEDEPLVAQAEHDLNYRTKKYALTLPTDPNYRQQWHLHTNLVNRDADDRSCSRCEEAWLELGNYGSDQVVVAITDDGCKLNHPDFGPSKFAGWGYFRGRRLVNNNDIDADPNSMYISGSDHGTACAGVVAAKVNGALVVGAAPAVKLLPIQWESNGPYLLLNDSKLLTALEYLADKVDVVSNSWGSAPSSNWPTLVINKINELATSRGRRGRGIIFTWAAGNENCPINYTANVDVPYTDGWGYTGNQPTWVGVETARVFSNNLAQLPGVLMVGAISSRAQRSHYSNYGPGLDLCAPSNNVHSYYRLRVAGLGISTTTGSSGGLDTGFGGTSSACPLVAGVAALVISANPNLSGAEVIAILKQTASKDLDLTGYARTPAASFDPDTSWDVSPVAPHHKGDFQNINSPDGTWSPWFGFGKVDALAAVKKARNTGGNPTVPTTNLKIMAALVNPLGADAGNEKVILFNPNAQDFDVSNWFLESANRRMQIQGVVKGGEALTLTLNNKKITLSNKGGYIALLDEQQRRVSRVEYTAAAVKEGVVLTF